MKIEEGGKEATGEPVNHHRAEASAGAAAHPEIITQFPITTSLPIDELNDRDLNII